MKIIKGMLAGMLMAGAAGTANAAVISLNFENINATYPSSSYANILEFYNGGTSSDGTSGTDYGISFGRNALAICLNSQNDYCSNTSRGGVGDPTSAKGGLFFLTGNETFMNVAAGFDTGFSFNYVSVSYSGSVTVYDGLNGTGNVLGVLNLTPNAGICPGGYNAGFCPFSASGINFSGTAHSVSFGGVANQIVFDDITFGSSTPGPQPGIPEPATWAMLIAGFGMVGASMRRRNRKLVTLG